MIWMALQWIVGPAGCGKSSYIKSLVAEQLKSDCRKKVILMVPEQATFTYQYDLLQNYGLEGVATLEILSFQRMAKQLSGSLGGQTYKIVDGLGKRILLRRLLQENKNLYPFLEKSIDRPGYLMQLGDIIQELKRYRVTPSMLADAHTHLAEGSYSFDSKLGELAELYSAYDSILAGDRIDYDDQLNLLAEQLENHAIYRDTEIWVDEFYDFTPQEYEVLRQLMMQAKMVSIALPLEKHPEDIGRKSVFMNTEKIYARVNEIAGNCNVTVLPDIELSRNARNAELDYLEQNYFRLGKHVYGDPCEMIGLTQAQNRLSEVDAVARNIRDLCRVHGYRYEDIAVLTRGNHYDDVIDNVLGDYEIPHFMDSKKQLKEHPVTEFLLAVMDIVETNRSYRSVFRLIKTGLLNSYHKKEEWDQLENYVLRYGIHGNAWVQEQDWDYRTKESDETLAAVNRLRRDLAAPLEAYRSATEEAVSAGEHVRSLYGVMEKFLVADALKEMMEFCEANGLNETVQVHQRVWKGLTELFDQIEVLLGDVVLSREEFRILMNSAFENLNLGMLPSSLDQVFVGAVSHSRTAKPKVVFLLGLNEGVFPQKSAQEVFFGETERQLLKEMGIHLGGTSEKRRYDEQFLVYLALTRASERVYFSYSISDEDGKAMRPSEMIGKLKRMYPQLAEEYVQWPPREESPIQYINHEKKAVGILGSRLNEDEAPEELWADVYNFFRNSCNPVFDSISDHIRYQEEYQIGKPVSPELFGSPLKLSVSALETYRKCPYSYFLNYGLGLKERDFYQVESVDLGSFYHAAMERFTEILMEEKIGWEELDEEKTVALMNRVVDQLAPELQHNILLSSGRYRYIKRRIGKTLEKSALYLLEHGKKGRFVPTAVEADFGFPKSKIPAFRFTLEDGTELQLKGKIDRVEQAELDGKQYLRIIDYKSGNLGLSLQDIYYGVKIQLITYLRVMMQHEKKQLPKDVELIPAGVLYYYFRGKILNADKPLSSDEAKNLHLKEMKAGGLLVADLQGIQLADRELEPGKKSTLLPVGMKTDAKEYVKDPEAFYDLEDKLSIFHKGNNMVTEEQMELLGQHTEKMIVELGEQIHRGEIPVHPYRTGKSSACKYCEFHAICQIGTADLNKISPVVVELSKEVIWDKIREEQEESV